MQIRMVCSRLSSPSLLKSPLLISFILLKLRSTVTYSIQMSQESEKVREKEELGASLGASSTVPLSKDNFINFYWQATAFSMPLLLQLRKIFFLGGG